MRVFCVLFFLLASPVLAATPDPATLANPDNSKISILALSWNQTTTPESEFICYRIIRSTINDFSSAEDLLPQVADELVLPTIGNIGLALLGELLFLVGYKKRLAVILLAVVAMRADAAVEDLWVSAPIRDIATTSYEDTCLDAGVTYYYKVYVTTTDGTNAASNAVSGSVLSRSCYTDNGDGTVTDNETGYIWKQDDDGVKRNFDDSVVYCTELDLAGYSDWSLPGLEVLRSIVDLKFSSPTIDINYFPATKSDYYYVAPATDAWNATAVNFLTWETISGSRNNQYYARCVRNVS